MGLYARLPFAVAPGMGLNAFFAFAIVIQARVPWQTALGMVFWSGVLFLVVSATPLREQIARNPRRPDIRLPDRRVPGLLFAGERAARRRALR
jgi:AGZA family xanthine/uracil permease-like MFS transporter